MEGTNALFSILQNLLAKGDFSALRSDLSEMNEVDIAEFLEELGYKKVYFGGVTLEKMEEEGIECTPENEKKSDSPPESLSCRSV